MNNLYDIQRVMLEQLGRQAFYERHIFEPITMDNAITGILGSRGIGKTTYLLHKVANLNKKSKQHALYVSADNPFFLTESLLGVADYLYKETDTQILCIDEIHKYPNWQQELKNIADIYKRIKVVFTGSSMIDIIHSKFDLSRRVTLHYFGGLSFREYLSFIHKIDLPLLTLSELLENHQSIAEFLDTAQLIKYFRQYLISGYYLFFKELTTDVDRFQVIENISQKIIYEDIALLHNLKTASLLDIEKTYKYVLSSSAGELNANKLANLLSKSYDQTMNYLQWLEQAGLINTVCINKPGKRLVKSPKKLLPENTNLMSAAYIPQTQHDLIGKMREVFFVNQLKNAKQNVFYSEVGDFAVDDMIFEVGGKDKTSQQIKDIKKGYIAADGILVGSKNIVPLYLFGCLY